MKARSRLLMFLGVISALVIAVLVYSAYRIEQSSASVLEIEALPHKKVGLVLGCSPVLRSGAPNLYFNHRIAAAALVFKSQKVDYLLLSGDNRHSTYDEPTAMKNALLDLGVPEDRIVLDYAGFSTFDSVVRAKEVFGLSELCIITQRDHALRALYLAGAQGMNAVAYPAKGVPTLNGLRTRFREALARVRALFDVHIWGRQPHFLGPMIPIGAATEPGA